MPFLHGLPRLVCALGGLALVGCYSPYRYAPYSPYGPGIPTYSPQVAPPPQFGPPVGSPTPVYPDGGIPGGGFPPPNGTFPPDASFGGSQFNNGSGLTPTPDPNSSFPPSDGGGFNPVLPSNPNSGPVPNYDDPNTLSPPPSGGTFGNGNVTPFNQDGASFRPDSDTSEAIGSLPYEPASPKQLQLAAHRSPPPASISVGNNPPPRMPDSPQGYGYDKVGYRWLSGIVDFDEQQKEWVLIYDLTPDPQDTFKGQITLINNPYLSRVQSSDLVHVEGYVDSSVRDRSSGKPQYRVQNIRGSQSPTS